MIQKRLIKVFSQRGMPQWIKVDNGLPLGDPNQETPPVLALWLISLGIEMIWNRPRQPRDNAKVERKQAVLFQWVEAHKRIDHMCLQRQLDQVIYFHNHQYPVQRLNRLTRARAFPELAQHSERIFKPKMEQLKPVLNCLARREWIRTVSKKGQLNLFNQRFQVGAHLAHQQIRVSLNPEKNLWQVFDHQGKWMKNLPTPFKIKAIRNLKLT